MAESFTPPPEERVEQVRVERTVGQTPAGEPVARERVVRVARDRGAEQQLTAFKLGQLLWTIAGIIIVLILLRAVLELIGANAANGFVHLVYSVTGPLVRPFRGIVSNPQSGRMVLDVAALIAVIVYAFVTWAIVRLLEVAFFNTRSRTVVDAERRMTRE